ncbi:MAG TPA: 4Fe-4S binding protein [Geobacteraceae bacterium]
MVRGCSTMGRIELVESRCKGCGLCTVACPGRLIELSPKLNIQGYQVITMADPEKCTGCALCARMCPDLAIKVFK